MPTISVRMTERDDKLIKEYAEMHNISVSDLIRNAVIEKIVVAPVSRVRWL